MAARRLAREGANVVGVDILEDLDAAVIDDIIAHGGSATFLCGDIANDSVCAEMVRVSASLQAGQVLVLQAGIVGLLMRPSYHPAVTT